MADKSAQLILDALTRAAAEPAGVPLHGGKAEAGLFPATAPAKAAAERARADGLIAVVANGKPGRELGVLTDKGRHFLVEQASPRQVLEDFVRVLEGRKAEVRELSEAVSRMAFGLEAMHAAVAQVLPRLTETNGMPMNRMTTAERPATTADALIADIKARLAEWHASVGNARDCSLPDLYRRLVGEVSVGAFHDALRQLHDDHQIYLHPWTGPLYTLPEPRFALMVGHEVAFYASAR